MRNIGVHIRGVLLLSILAGCLAVGLSLASPNTYSSTSTLRVVPPGGSLDTNLLSTSVEWYAALGDVPEVLNTASNRSKPAVSTTTLREASTLVPGAGPGEIIITATSPDERQAISMNDALAETLVETVNKDEELQLGGTQLSVLLPAETQGQLGSGVATMFVTGFLAGFVLLATAAGLLHSFVNWRLNARILKALGAQLEIPAFTSAADLALFAGQQARTGPQTWVAASSRIDPSAWTAVQQEVAQLGTPTRLVRVSEAADPAGGEGPVVYLPDPNDGSPAAIAAASHVAAPAVVLATPGTRLRQVRDCLSRLDEVGIPVSALALIKSKVKTVKEASS